MSGSLVRFAKVLGIVGVATILVVPSPSGTAAEARGSVKKIQRKTVVTPVLDHPVDARTNLIYVGTFQMAWNSMTRDIVGEKILLDRPIELVDRLNRNLAGDSHSGLEDLDPSEFLLMAGYGKDSIADRINDELRDRFSGDVPMVDTSFNDDDVILAYSFLDKVSGFVYPFPASDRPLLFDERGESAAVQAFGLGPGAYSGYDSGGDGNMVRGQVEVLEYVHDGEFIVRLKTDDPGEELIVASVEPGASLRETCDDVQWRIAASTVESMGQSDVMIMPVLDVRLEESFSPLLGRYLLNDGFREYFVAEARQDVRFRLDNTGVSLESRGVFALKKGGPVGKSLIFRGPFLLYLKRKGSDDPYFAMWVGNSAVMENAGS